MLCYGLWQRPPISVGGRFSYMGYAKKFGKIEQIKHDINDSYQGYRFFVGYCPECKAKHYIGIEDAREMAKILVPSLPKEKVHIKIPHLSIDWV